jgi:ubiquinone/menaquinone biosynthesis C-methylase UbiE
MDQEIQQNKKNNYMKNKRSLIKNPDVSSNEQLVSELIINRKWPPENFRNYLDDRNHWLLPENLQRIDQTLKMIYKKSKGGKCLDVGFGNSLVLTRELEIFPTCFGLYIDPSKAIEKGIPKSILIKGDCYKMPFEPEEFDLVSAYAFLHVIPNIPQFYLEAYRVLKKGGYLYTDNDKSIYTVKLIRKIRMAQYCLLGKKYKDKYKHWREILHQNDTYHSEGVEYFALKRILKEIGFKKVILIPVFSVNPIYKRHLIYRLMKLGFNLFKFRFFHTHIQILAIK